MLWQEGLSRRFANRRQLAAYAGLAPSPWRSGDLSKEQGISKSGNARLRTTMIEAAWLWLRHPPKSALSLWFKNRVKVDRGRHRGVAIVALARKLLIAFWRFATEDLALPKSLKSGNFTLAKAIIRWMSDKLNRERRRALPI